jgi:hypothetical protein
MDRTERCRRIVSAIEGLSNTEIEELFRMIHKERYEYTRTNHGVFINLSWISETMLQRMEQYIQFCKRSKDELIKYESICDLLNNKMTETRDKQEDNTPAPISTSTVEKNTTDSCGAEDKSNVSTSMRFYLLKKRFSKMTSVPVTIEKDLKPDTYLITT